MDERTIREEAEAEAADWTGFEARRERGRKRGHEIVPGGRERMLGWAGRMRLKLLQ